MSGKEESQKSSIHMSTLDNRRIATHSELKTFKESDFIMIREDKIEIWQLRAELYESTQDKWQAPLGVFVSLLAALCTANFTGSEWLDAGTLKGMFLLACVGSGAWLVWALWRKFTAEKHDDLLTFLRKESEGVDRILAEADEIRELEA